MNKARWHSIPWGPGDIIAYGILLTLALGGLIWAATWLAGAGYLTNLSPNPLSILVLSALVQSGLMLGLALWISLVKRGASWSDLGLAGIQGFPWLGGLGGGGLMLAVALAFSLVAGRFFAQPPPQSIVQEFSRHMGPKAVAALIFVVVVLAPLTEELVFRGFVFGGLRRALGFLPAALLTSVLFAAVHLKFNWIQFFQILILGIILARLYEAKGNLMAPILAHALYNGVLALLLISGALGGGS